jgi:hypothetical protein
MLCQKNCAAALFDCCTDMQMSTAQLTVSRPLISHIHTAYQNSGTNRFRPLFPKSVHKASVYKTICSINVALLLDNFGDRHVNYKHRTDLMKSVIRT